MSRSGSDPIAIDANCLSKKLGGGLRAAAFSLLTVAAHAHGVPEALRACAREADDAARLACFDRELARQTAKGESQPPAEEAPQEPVSAVVSRVAERADGTLVVTLDNGQVWAQVKRAYVPLKPGDAVRIERGALGSVYLFTPSRRSTQVKRLK